MSQPETLPPSPSPVPFPFPHRDGLDPLPELAELRRDAPVLQVRLPSGDLAWLVTRHADVRRILADARFSRARATRGEGPRINRTTTLPDSILAADPPEHSRLRRLISPALSARRAEAMRRDIAHLTHDLLARLEPLPRPADLVAHFTRPLPLTVICDLLGTPRVDGDRLDAWNDALRSVTAMTDAEVMAAVAEMTDYLTGLIAAKRAHPGDDMLSVLIAARDEGDRLSEGELVSFCIVLLAGGYGTTADRLAGLVHLLLEQPERYELLCHKPALIPGAIEELLRYAQAVVGANLRVATEDVVLGGVTVKEGEAVVALTSSANHDERVYAEPALLDLTRAAPAHLAFGHGAHFCVGAQLARVQLQEALTGLVNHLPTLHPAGPPEWKRGQITRAPRTLPVTW
ncbi:cytochrome P450 [Kitasatospora aureofaciens]|uniref:cytochrome P450 n=1 Tax=Kitasatospora aureofaciens TaxID=1894 RepID=UPI001C437E38|nr:cytochrome P450 [Kitasatospora aureofaciens]MBV6699958.1 cytochrome P450 [Kitasatospora aureofaciens]